MEEAGECGRHTLVSSQKSVSISSEGKKLEWRVETDAMSSGHVPSFRGRHQSWTCDMILIKSVVFEGFMIGYKV